MTANLMAAALLMYNPTLTVRCINEGKLVQTAKLTQ